MAKRRVNKNVVAFITVAGILLAVVVVAIATYNASRRDPAAIALKAKAQESLDPRRAIALYRGAFDESKDARYLLEAARVAREMGNLNMMFGLLNAAYAQSPDDPAVLSTLLERYWEIRDFSMGQWRDVRERAVRLCQQQPDNLLALASLAEALEWLKDDEATRDERLSIGGALEWLTLENASLADLADQILARAAEIDPTSAYVALVRARQSELRVAERLRDALQQRRPDVDQIGAQAAAERVAYLQPALAAHPDDVPLRIACGQALVATGDWAAGRALLQAGIESQPEDPDLRFELARMCVRELRQRTQQAADAARAELPDVTEEEAAALVQEAARSAIDPTLVAEGLRSVHRAVELEPGLYNAYIIRADLQRLEWEADGSWKADPRGRQKAILDSYATALSDNVGLESFRAMLAKFRLERLQVISAGFENALSFHRSAADPETRAQALTYMRSFMGEAQTQYPEWAQTSLMEGHVAVIDGDLRLALRAFSRAEEQAERIGGRSAAQARLAREELSKLYRARGELGLALDYTVEVLESYRQERLRPPRWVLLQHIDVLLGLNRAQEALDQVVVIDQYWPDWPLLKAVRARALTALDRGDEALREMEQLPGDDPRYLLERARIAALNEDYDAALTALQRILETDPEDAATIDRFLRVLIAAERSDEARQFIRERLPTTSREAARVVLQGFDLMLSESDPQVREQRRLEMIAAISDEYERAHEYFTFWRVKGDWQRAAEYLDEMERLQPDDPDVQRLQFEVAMRTADCPRAERYAARLAQADVDRMGGALYRGRYELACGTADRALAEFRSAEREFPRDPGLKAYLARALVKLDPPRYEEAIQVLEQAVQYDPQNFDTRKLLYACYETLGRRDEGIPHLKEALRLAAQARFRDEYIEARAQLLAEEEDPAQGIENRQRLRQENPQDVSNLLRLAELHWKVNDAAAARECLQAAVEVEPADSRVARFAARVFAELDDREAGEQLLQRHLEAQEGVGEIVARGLLGRFYETLADRELTRAREASTAGEPREAVQARVAAAADLRRRALRAYQQAQERVEAATAGGSEQERHRAMVAAASELAEFHRRGRDWESMLEACRVILVHLEPDDATYRPLVRLRIVNALQSLQRSGEAGEELERLRRDYPDYLPGMTAEAELLLVAGEHQRARELLSRVLADDPDHIWSLITRARISIGQQRYPEARDDLLRAKEVAPRSIGFEHRFELARLYELMGKPELAEAELRELLSPEFDRGGDPAVELRLIALLKRTGQIEEAQTFVNTLIAEYPRQPLWSYELGKLLMERQEHSAAVRPLRRAAELTEFRNAAVIEAWLRALVEVQRSREVIDFYYEFYETRGVAPPPSIKVVAAEAYLAAGQRDIAALLLEQALGEASLLGVRATREMPHRAEALLGREDTLALLHRLVERTGGTAAGLVLRIALAESLITDPDPAKQATALPEIEAVLSELPPEDQELHLEALLTHAIVLDRVGRSEQAVGVYEQVLELQASDIRALNNLAYLLADKLSRPAEALPYARRLQEVAPTGSAAALDTVGWVYFKNGDSQQALPVFLEAARIDPTHLAVHYHLGLLYADRGRSTEAEREFRRVLDLAQEQQNADYVGKAQEALDQLRG
jgi:tetratricopeptide (TPR) repeat protein